jgi:hypothetical protein
MTPKSASAAALHPLSVAGEKNLKFLSPWSCKKGVRVYDIDTSVQYTSRADRGRRWHHRRESGR